MQDYYNSKESVQQYIEMAKDVNSRQLINRFASLLHQNSEVLELGSGPGTDWRILSEKFNVLGSDNSQEFLNHLQANNPNGSFIKLDASNLDTSKTFDGIYSNKVLHHLKTTELKESVKQQNEILNKSGIICHSFWKGQGDETFKGMFVNYHDKIDLEQIFAKYFEPIEISYYNEFEKNDSVVFIGRKK